jgi:hypothetical protein
VNQASDRLGMDAELVGDLSDADEPCRFFTHRRHDPPEPSQVLRPCAWAARISLGAHGT